MLVAEAPPLERGSSKAPDQLIRLIGVVGVTSQQRAEHDLDLGGFHDGMEMSWSSPNTDFYRAHQQVGVVCESESRCGGERRVLAALL